MYKRQTKKVNGICKGDLTVPKRFRWKVSQGTMDTRPLGTEGIYKKV